MDMVLSGRRLSAQEALDFGLVSRVAPDGELMTLSMEVAAAIADKAPVALRLAKGAVNAAFETTLAEGIRLERRLFTMLFATEDQKEGMAAFIEKRKPVWRGQ
ncbi:MAG: enoyl-CoA hydratase-related protein [Caldilineaceae bacterium]